MVSTDGSCICDSNYPSSASACLDREKFSIFSEGSCGDPLPAQHLHLDFTRNQRIDTDFIQNKICSFWKFVHSTPEIQNLMVRPDRNSKGKNSTTPQESRGRKTAISMLQLAQKKGFIDDAFETKMSQSTCMLGSRELKHKDSLEPLIFKPKKRTSKTEDLKPFIYKKIRMQSKKALEPLTKSLCKQLTDWDAEHSEFMEPPGNPSNLSHAIMQRQVYECRP